MASSEAPAVMYSPWIEVKDSVRFDKIDPAGFVILAALVLTSREIGVKLKVTSGTDSHKAPDPHALGKAYDLATSDMDPATVMAVRAGLQRWLNGLAPKQAWTVLYESPSQPRDPRLAAILTVNPNASAEHIHIQPAKGTLYTSTLTDKSVK